MPRVHSGTSTAHIFATRLLIMLMTLFLSLGLIGLLAPLQTAQAQPDLDLSEEPDARTWVTNGYVNAIATDGDVTYIGGDFSRVGPNTGCGVVFNASDNDPLSPYLRINDDVYTSASDGSGGWYIGGYFSGVGGMERDYIAHILPDGSLDPGWNPEIDGQVSEIAVGDGKVYIAGYFNTVGGQLRNYLAALDAATGAVTAWNPNPNSDVYALAFDGGTVYAGGYFNSIGGQSRRGLAALDPDTGAATAWNPNPNSNVYCLAADGGTVYVGGYFNSIGGQSRTYLAALDATGAATAWNPNPNSNVYSLTVSGGTVFVCGTFNWIGSQPRNYMAALDAGTGLANGFDPKPDYPYDNVLAVDGSTIYAAGYFTNIGGKNRSHLAALDAATGAATAWNPNPNDRVIAISLSGGRIFAGGYFNSVGGVYRDSLAALDASGKPTDWNPGVNYEVETLDFADGLVYAGGYFDFIGGQPRHNIAALDATTGAATDWNPGADNDVHCLSVSNGTVYAGGIFHKIGGKARDHLAALDTATGDATAWNPKPNDYLYDLEVANGLVYAGGEFTSIGGKSRSYLAALDTTSGAATDWNPNADDAVICIAANDGLIYTGGFFSHIGGETRYNIAALDAASGMATGWNPGADSFVSALALRGNTIYAGGYFSYIGNNQRYGLAALDAAGNSTGWNPNGNLDYYYFKSSSEGGASQPSVEAGEAPAEDKQAYRDMLAESGSLTASSKDIRYIEPVSDFAFVGNTLYVSGWFDSIGYYSQGGIAAFTGSTDTWYMAEGSTAGGMETWILVENPNDAWVTVDLAFDTEKGQVAPPELQGVSIPAHSRSSFNAGTFLASYDVSTIVTSHGGDVACERALYGNGRAWASSSVGTRATSTAWYLAEGTTAGGMETWVLVQNPNDSAVSMDVSFLTGGGEYGPSELQNYSIAPHRRVSIYAGAYVTDYDVSTRVVTDGAGVVCERSTYGPATGNEETGTWATSSMGAKGPSRTWYLAEGATDEGRETWVLVENPYDLPVDVDVVFVTGQGEVQGPSETIPGKSRRTYNAGDYVTASDVSTMITSTGAGVICERAFYANGRSWATSSPGSDMAAMHWDLPEGSTDGGMETWVIVFNPGDSATDVSMAFQTGGGLVEPPELQGINLPARTRITLRVNNYVTSYDVSTRVVATSGVVCERSTYGPAGAGGAGSWATCSEGAY
jgi:hypothetical protein